jgi:hypothetical protein
MLQPLPPLVTVERCSERVRAGINETQLLDAHGVPIIRYTVSKHDESERIVAGIFFVHPRSFIRLLFYTLRGKRVASVRCTAHQQERSILEYENVKISIAGPSVPERHMFSTRPGFYAKYYSQEFLIYTMRNHRRAFRVEVHTTDFDIGTAPEAVFYLDHSPHEIAPISPTRQVRRGTTSTERQRKRIRVPQPKPLSPPTEPIWHFCGPPSAVDSLFDPTSVLYY